MNQAQRQALEAAISQVGGDLAMARLQKKADPNWVSGNGETIDEVIAGYERHLAQLKGE